MREKPPISEAGIIENAEAHRLRPERKDVYKSKESVDYVLLTRHGNRFAGAGEWKNPATGEVVSFSDTENLTPSGIENSKEFGANLPSVDYVLTVASLEPRAAQTADAIAVGAGKDLGLPVAHHKDIGATHANQVVGISYKELSDQGKEMIKKVKPIINAKAAEYPDYGLLTPEMRSEVRHKAQETGLAVAMKDKEFVEEAAEGLAYNIWTLRAIADASHKVAPGNKVAMPLVNHAAFNESFLLKALKVEDKKTGERVQIDSVKDLGDFFKPGESFQIKTARTGDKETEECVFTDPARQKLFAGKKLSIDWEVVEDLFHKYEERLAEREKRDSRFKRGEALAKE